MADDTKPERHWQDQAKDALLAFGLGSALLVPLFSGVAYFTRNEVRDGLRDFLGIEAQAAIYQTTQDEISDLREAIETLTEEMRASRDEIALMSGTNDVVQALHERHYIEEPVRRGEILTVHLLLRRTKLGAACLFVESVPIFRDRRNIPRPGVWVGNPVQIGSSWTPLINEARTPEDLVPGVVFLSLHLEYTCDGEPVFQELPTIRFNLLE